MSRGDRGGGAPGGQLASTGMRAAGRAAMVMALATLTVLTGACTKSNAAGMRSNMTPSEGVGGHQPMLEDAAAMPRASTSASGGAPLAKEETAPPSQPVDSGVRVCSTEEGAQWIAAKGRYSPPGNVYPAIVQGDEYGPIEAIQTVYAQAQASGAAKFGELEITGDQEVRSDASKIVITGLKGPVSVDLSERQIRIGRRSFADSKTISLFQTLGRLLADLGSQCKHQGIRGSHLRTRAYKDSIGIEFSYGPVVVRLEALSNGPANSERLYLLDVVKSKDSSLWARERNVGAKQDDERAP